MEKDVIFTSVGDCFLFSTYSEPSKGSALICLDILHIFSLSWEASHKKLDSLFYEATEASSAGDMGRGKH